MKNTETMSAAVKAVIDSYPAGHRFYGNQLKDDVVNIHPESEFQFVDTILRMARRHRRHAFRVVDRNNSLYEKTAVKPILKELKELREKAESRASRKRQPEHEAGLLQLPLFSSLLYFLPFFTGLASGFGCFLGRPTGSTFRIISTVSGEYIASLVIGLIFAFEIRFLQLSYVMPKTLAISLAVIPSIFFIIGNYSRKLEKCHYHVKNTIQAYSGIEKKIKYFHFFVNLYLT